MKMEIQIEIRIGYLANELIQFETNAKFQIITSQQIIKDRFISRFA